METLLLSAGNWLASELGVDAGVQAAWAASYRDLEMAKVASLARKRSIVALRGQRIPDTVLAVSTENGVSLGSLTYPWGWTVVVTETEGYAIRQVDGTVERVDF